MTQLVVNGNAKLGPGVTKTSLEAVASCPGATDLCRNACYADRIQGFRKNVLNAWRVAFVLAQGSLEEYEKLVLTQLSKRWSTGKTNRMVLFAHRIHESGDFFSEEYIDAWIRIAKARPLVRFYSYTRSWRVPELLPALERLAALPNVHLWASTDDESGPPPKGWREARMLPKGVKRIDKFATCPEQTGKQESCTTCTLCWKAKEGARLAFIRH